MVERVALVHWNAAEAGGRAERLRAFCGEVELIVDPRDPGALRALRERPPSACVIDLTRLPSHGRAVAVALRQWKATRAVPLLFVEGAPEKVAATRALLPDAVYTDWTGVAGALREALAGGARDGVVPGTMAGYSGTPLPKKLGIKPGAAVALLCAPDGFEANLPEDVRAVRALRGPCDLILLFVRSRAELHRRLPAAQRALAEKGGLWIVWPKKTSALAGDLTQQAVRETGLASGLVDYKICAVDETWSGLLFAWRRKA